MIDNSILKLEEVYKKFFKPLYLLVSKNAVLKKEISNAIISDLVKYSKNTKKFRSIFIRVTEDYLDEFSRIEDLALGQDYIILIIELFEIDEIIEGKIFYIFDNIVNKNIFIIISVRDISSKQRRSMWYNYLCENGIVIYEDYYSKKTLGSISLTKMNYLFFKKDCHSAITKTLIYDLCLLSQSHLLLKTGFSKDTIKNKDFFTSLKQILVIEDFARTILIKDRCVIYKKMEYFKSILGVRLIILTLMRIHRKVSVLNSKYSEQSKEELLFDRSYKALKKIKKLYSSSRLNFINSLILFIKEVSHNT